MIKSVCDVFATLIMAAVITSTATPTEASADPLSMPFAPGENLLFRLRWENITAGEIKFEVKPIETIKGIAVYHFVMTTKSTGLAEMFFKTRERIDAYAETQMAHSILYKKRQTEGDHKRDVTIDFDWQKQTAQYTNFNESREPIDLLPGSLDPLSALYFTRLAINNETSRMERPVTNGKKNFMGRATVVRRETITLSNGKNYDTYCLAPDMGLFGGVFKKSKDPELYIWVTADDKRIPVLIKSKVKVGHFIGELVSAEH